MKCPYAVTRHMTQQTVFEYDETGAQTMQQTIEHNVAEFIDCVQEECGAWKDGQCRYNQAD